MNMPLVPLENEAMSELEHSMEELSLTDDDKQVDLMMIISQPAFNTYSLGTVASQEQAEQDHFLLMMDFQNSRFRIL